MIVALLVTSAFAAVPTHDQLGSASWTQLTTKQHDHAGDVGVWKATIEGVECFRATAETPQKVSVMLDIVSDIESVIQWSHAGVTEAEVLKKSGDHLEYYQYLDVPGWTMASDRFWFCEGDAHRTETGAHFRWTGLKEGGPHKAAWEKVKAEHPSAVEPTLNVGEWRFETKGDGASVTYSICTNPGGSIPGAVQNAATRRTLPDTVGDVIKEAKRRSGT